MGLIGCGNIGTKRAQAIQSFPRSELVSIVEADRSRWPLLEAQFRVSVSDEVRLITESEKIDVVVISTLASSHIPLIAQCFKNGKDVLCEKPLAETLRETEEITKLAREEKKILKCGFNLRHDKGIERARQLLGEGVIGKPYFFKAHYVNGCVLVNANRVGSLMDMGSHLLDLVRWYLGEPKGFQGFLQSTEFPHDDNGFVTFHIDGVGGQIHFSFLRWRNDFCLEVSGEKGAIEVVNLPKWGKQEVHLYERVYPSGVPPIKTEIFEGDQSWNREWEVFCGLVEARDFRFNDDGLKVMQVISEIQSRIPVRNFAQ